MATIILIFLIAFWFAGYGPLQALHIPLFKLFGHVINLWDILIFLLIIKLIDLLPGLIRSIVVIGLVLWVLSIFGFLVLISSHIILIALIIGVGIYLISGK